MNNNNKKLSYALLCIILAGSSNISKSEEHTISPEILLGLATIGSVIYLGNKAQQKNEEYSENNKKPDLPLATWKTVAGAATLLCGEWIFGEGDFEKKAKITLTKAAILSICIPFASDPAGDVARKIPVIGGFLSDPIDKEDGKEQKNIGALMRFLVPYIALRQAASNKKLIT